MMIIGKTSSNPLSRLLSYVLVMFLLMLIFGATAILVLVGSPVIWVIPIFIALLFALMLYLAMVGFKLSMPLLSFGLILYFTLPQLYMISGAYFYYFIQFYFVFVGLFFVKELISVVRSDSLLLVSFVFFWLFMSFALVSALVPVNYEKSTMAILFQFVMNLKPYLILAFCFGVVKLYGDEVWRLISRLGKWLVAPMYICIALQFTMPSIFFTIFPFVQASPLADGLFPSRGVGIFEYSSFLAAFSAFYTIFYFSVALCQQNQKLRIFDFILSGSYLFLLLCAIQRQELVSLFCSLVVVFILYQRIGILKRSCIAAFILVGLSIIFLSLYGDMTSKEMETWGGNRFTAITHPRANLYDGAFNIAEDYFPLGSGLGSYAGIGSTKYNQDLLYKMGFGKMWWFDENRSNYLMDSYWANPIAEAGFIGAVCLFLHYIMLLVALGRRLYPIGNNVRPYSVVAFSSVLYILLTSATSPSFIEPRIIFFPFLTVACALLFERKGG
jgi:hypothetical protein